MPSRPGGRATPGRLVTARSASPFVPGTLVISSAESTRFVVSRGARSPSTSMSTLGGASGAGSAVFAAFGAVTGTGAGSAAGGSSCFSSKSKRKAMRAGTALPAFVAGSNFRRFAASSAEASKSSPADSSTLASVIAPWSSSVREHDLRRLAARALALRVRGFGVLHELRSDERRFVRLRVVARFGLCRCEPRDAERGARNQERLATTP